MARQLLGLILEIHCCTIGSAEQQVHIHKQGSVQKRQEKTTLVSVVKEKLMLNLSFPLASANTRRGGRGSASVSLSSFVPVTCFQMSSTVDHIV